jgi:hypothetical protein
MLACRCNRYARVLLAAAAILSCCQRAVVLDSGPKPRMGRAESCRTRVRWTQFLIHG